MELKTTFITLLVAIFNSSINAREVDDDDGPIVETTKGKVRGLHYEVPHLKATGEEYLGIPFAMPPVESKRFRYPEPIEPWSDKNVILNATRLPNSCPQEPDLTFGESFWGSTMWNPNTPVSEDCLYLNVWVPRSASDGKRPLPVMVWIFGGGFYSGTTTLTLYDGKILASLHQVVVVSIGYRIGALGFLCLDNPSAPCNMGLFDQLLGLDWVQRNIERFGGDPSNVTLFGESAGAVSVSLHLLSPLSRDMFHRAILQSGTANMPWATLTLAEGVRRSKELAVGYLRCEDGDSVDLAKCLRELKWEYLIEHQWVSRGILQFPFLPVVDGIFLTESPSTALKRRNFKKCPILLGSNLNEGSWFLIYELSEHLNLQKTDMPREAFLSDLLHVFYYYPQYPQRLNSSEVFNAIAFQYTDWKDSNDSFANVRGMDQAVGDSQFVCPLNQFAASYADAGLDVYMYFLTMRYSTNPWPEWMGVLHGDDILYVFGHVLKEPLEYSEEDRQLSRKIMALWTTFAKTGSPNVMNDKDPAAAAEQLSHASPPPPAVVWPRYTSSKKEYLNLNEKRADAGSSADPTARPGAIGQGPRVLPCAFWTEYVPYLMTTTANLEDKENEWKQNFAEWSAKYLPEWKRGYDRYQKTERCED